MSTKSLGMQDGAQNQLRTESSSLVVTLPQPEKIVERLREIPGLSAETQKGTDLINYFAYNQGTHITPITLMWTWRLALYDSFSEDPAAYGSMNKNFGEVLRALIPADRADFISEAMKLNDQHRLIRYK